MNSTVWQCGGSAYNSGNVIVQALGILHKRHGGSVLWSLIRTKFGQIIFTEGLEVFFFKFKGGEDLRCGGVCVGLYVEDKEALWYGILVHSARNSDGSASLRN